MNRPEASKASMDQEFPKAPRQVRQHVAEWVNSGLLEADLARRLLEHSSRGVSRGARNILGMVMSAIAGVFVLAGVILLIAEHWEAIPRGIKLAGALGLMAGCQYGGWRWSRHPDALRRWMSEALLIVGGGMIIGVIGLVSQIYNLNSRPANGVLLWLILLAPLPRLTRSTGLWLMSVGVLTSWLGMEFNQSDSWLYGGNWGGEIWLWMMLGLIVWAFAEARRDIYHPMGVSFARVCGAALFLGTTLGFGFGIEDHFRSESRWMGVSHPMVAGLFAAIGPLVWLVSAREEIRKRGGIRIFDLLILVFWGCLFLPLIHNPPFWGALLWAMHLVLCVLLVREGAEEGRMGWVNLGVLFILISILCRYFEFFGHYLDGGLFFIVTGLFFLGLVWFMEKQRRRWASKARRVDSQNEPSSIVSP